MSEARPDGIHPSSQASVAAPSLTATSRAPASLASTALATPTQAPRVQGNEATGLPPLLRHLLDRERFEVARWEELTMWPGKDGARRTFRIDGIDGRRVKGRVVRRPDTITRMRRWCPRLPAGQAVPVLASYRTSIVEGWCEGPALRPDDEEGAAEAGALLFRMQATAPLEIVDGEDLRFASLLRDVSRWARTLVKSGHLSTGDRTRLVDRATSERPSAGTWGLRHGDFAPDNLVRTATGLCCVDNTTVAAHFLESDLAQTAYRWPLVGTVRERFLDGYARAGGPARWARPTSWERHEAFWMICALLRAADFRVREGMSGVEIPLDRLLQHARGA